MAHHRYVRVWKLNIENVPGGTRLSLESLVELLIQKAGCQGIGPRPHWWVSSTRITPVPYYIYICAMGTFFKDGI